MNVKVDGWHCHDGKGREVKLRGQTFFHFHCIRCRRDFVKQADSEEWRAAHLGVFQFNLLEGAINARWVYELCPGRPLAIESNDMRRGTLTAATRKATFVATALAKVPDLVAQTNSQEATTIGSKRAIKSGDAAEIQATLPSGTPLARA
jgi:hypothetical protein